MTMTPADLKALGISLPPTQNDLPYDNGEPMESQRHQLQMELLIDSLLPWLDARTDGYVGGNMFIYFSLAQVRTQDFRGPDFFAVLGVPKGERKSWVCWEEGKTPDVVIELLSESTANVDKNEKKQIYASQLRVPEYFWYDPFNPQDWAGFRLQGSNYQAIAPNAQEQLVSQALGLCLIRWTGLFKQVETTWLRWANLDGDLLLTAEEREHQRANQAEQRANQAESQIHEIVRNLLQTGMSSEQVSQVTGLSIDQVEGWRS